MPMRSVRLLLLFSQLIATFSFALAADEWPPEIQRWLGRQTWERAAWGRFISLGEAGQFDDMHISAPAVIEEDGRYLLWYSGSRGSPANRVFRLGLATGRDGKSFDKH